MIPQLPLPLARARDISREPFIESASNARALALIDAAWPGGVLALVGPEGSGKTHLATHWAAANDAVFLQPGAIADPQDLPEALVIEDADAWPDAEALFHLWNSAQAGQRRLLLTARTPPAAWPVSLADLRSRLNAVAVAELEEPDDALLAQVLAVLFRERFITPAEDLIPYLLRRMERSFRAARAVVERLDAAGHAQSRGVNRALAVRELEVADVINDLFDDRL